MEDFKVDFSNYEQKERFLSYIRGLRGVQVINVNAAKFQRSLPLNDYYHGIVLPYWAKATGHTVSRLHRLFKSMFIPHVTFQNHMDLSTASCDQKEMIEYCEHIKDLYMDFFSEPRNEFRDKPLICTIPDPESVIRVDQELEFPED